VGVVTVGVVTVGVVTVGVVTAGVVTVGVVTVGVISPEDDLFCVVPNLLLLGVGITEDMLIE
jgi:hypothetical protein